MNRRTIIALVVVHFSALAIAAPPKVVKTMPENGDMNVKPGPTKIRILFDQDMSSGGFSICGGGEHFPEIIGEPQWTGKRSIVFASNLKPNHEYTFSVNAASFKNFKSVRGEAAEIYVVRFMTTFENGYVVHFAAKDDSELTTRKELLDAFNAQCPKSVRTF